MTPATYLVATAFSGQIYAMPMPPADQLDQTMHALRLDGIDSVLCLLEEQESIRLGLANEQTACLSADMQFRRFAIEDFGVPQPDELDTLVDQLSDDLKHGNNILVHCRGGVGRTGLICCCVLVATGMDAKIAINLVSKKRGCRVPETSAQIDMITQFALRQQKNR